MARVRFWRMARESHLSTFRTPQSLANARDLRRAMTDVERRIWYFLRAGRFQRAKFRRQVPLGPYVVDFLCESTRLIVELDGGQHAERVSHDLERTRWLEARGYRVVRFWNNEVTGNLEGVLSAIAKAMARKN